MKHNPADKALRCATGSAEGEIILRRSRFLSKATPVSTREDAEAMIKEEHANHPDANHVVYAYLIGDERSETAGLSDAGEPRGTAGRPVMEILRGSGIRNCLITVVRYFGGTKLGTGGLVHAYGDAARAVVKSVPTREFVPLVGFAFITDYKILKPVRAALADADAQIDLEQFDEQVHLTGVLPATARDAVEQRVRDLSHGRADINFYTS